MLSIGVKELLESGVHFGHQTRRWNPKMKPFIFDARNGIHIIDLSKTLAQLEAACGFLSETVRKGGKVVFVGTKKQAQQCVKDTAKECGQFFVTERWLGGTLTNYNTIKSSIKRLKEIEKMDADGTLANYGKQEQAVIRRETGRLQKYFDGIRAMDKVPAAMFVVDIKREHNAVAEARKLLCEVAFRNGSVHRLHHGRIHGAQTGTARSAGRNPGAADVGQRSEGKGQIAEVEVLKIVVLPLQSNL